VFTKIAASKASMKEKENMIFATDLLKMSYAHLTTVAFLIFRNHMFGVDIKCKNLEKHITNLAILYGIDYLKQDCSSLYECGYFNKGHGKMLDEAFKLTLAKLRPQLVGLVEIFDYPDEVLMSAIGNSYGDIYETHLEWAQSSRLNNNKGSIPDGWVEHIMPILQGKL